MSRENGFTLVELLVVMLILGLLATVAIPSFIDARAKVAVRKAQTAAETVATENNGEYGGPGGVTVASLEAAEITLQDADLSVPAVTADSYRVRVGSDTGNSFDITRNEDGTTDLTCATTGQAGCPEDGSWAGTD